MVPISLDPRALNLGLAGHGPAALRRWQLLAAGGAMRALCFADEPDAALQAEAGDAFRIGLPDDETLSQLDVLWIVGMPDSDAAALGEKARRHKVLVNVEDRRDHCSFHNAAEVRRGDLLLTVSTDGRSPGLAQRIRGFLAQTFGPEWGGRLETLGNQRDAWRSQGDDMPTLAAKTENFLQQTGWLAELMPHRK
ncbi:precorrin-2 dehydrogenase/sirohydrochlorin ferrochelatase family protein [Acidisoma silvae]|uniref:precorrin-2 dehydrogenase n=1 Tax=Acidisoma silvae TaxID=2802396 RepID=A0A964DXD2_9PROT|nr:NAD(P)-dependent oxidoreductase [Acidisoma silvae]MCB8873779.1 siroheme synthase [Acidisoma silvae]